MYFPSLLCFAPAHLESLRRRRPRFGHAGRADGRRGVLHSHFERGLPHRVHEQNTGELLRGEERVNCRYRR